MRSGASTKDIQARASDLQAVDGGRGQGRCGPQTGAALSFKIPPLGGHQHISTPLDDMPGLWTVD